jgi:hypothetical protein
VPQTQAGAPPVRIQTGRYGEMEAHELIKLLDTIEDERARSRFRESVYISVFIWMVIAWVVLYGPRYLWHAPQLINPADVLKQRDITLNAPILSPKLSRPVVKPVPKALDSKMLERRQWRILRLRTRFHQRRRRSLRVLRWRRRRHRSRRRSLTSELRERRLTR